MIFVKNIIFFIFKVLLYFSFLEADIIVSNGFVAWILNN